MENRPLTLDEKTLWMLDKIQEACFLCREKDFDDVGAHLTTYGGTFFKETPDGPDLITQQRILRRLDDDGFIKLTHMPYAGMKEGESSILVKIIEPQFTLFFRGLKKFSEDKYKLVQSTGKDSSEQKIEVEKARVEAIICENKGNCYFNIKGHKIDIGKSKNTPSLLLNSLMPIGIEKSVDKVFDESTPKSKINKYKQERLSLQEKMCVLKNTRVKELQDKFNTSKSKIKISLISNLNKGTVFLNISR